MDTDTSHIEGIKAYLSQADTHQIIFMGFENDVDLPEHFHASQFDIVLEGKIDLTIDGAQVTYEKGDRYYIPEGIGHSGKIYAGYADITFLMNLIGTRRSNHKLPRPFDRGFFNATAKR